MFSKILIKTFIKNSDDIKNDKVRSKYGLLGGIVGIFTNLILFIIKLSVGLLSGSIAIIADAFNNLSDAASSVITIIGFRMADKPADAEHPFGHGRIEYLSALIVSFMVMLVGIQFTKTSIERILNPTIVVFEILPFILLLVSIILKLWLSTFNKYVGNKINSSALKAASVDALGDVFTSSCVVISFLLSKFTSLPIDGFIGVIVSLFIIYSGFSLIKETINPLLGEAPDPELVKSIENEVLSYPLISGVHDLIIHNYGPDRCMASIHAEIPADRDIMEIHDIIDQAEREISEKLKIYLVIHMDPICIKSEEVESTYNEILNIINNHPLIISMHDFRFVGEGEKKNLIFDIVVNPEEVRKNTTVDDLKKSLSSEIKKIHPEYNSIITVDFKYS